MHNKEYYSLISLSGLIVILAVCIFIYHPQNILSWDVFGYYLYLPLTFIYQDLGLKDVQIIHDLLNKYDISGSFYQAWLAESGTWVIKYTCGEAVLLLPFFLLAQLITLITGSLADGFAPIYQYSILSGCFFYLCLALILLRKILLHFFNDKTAAVTLLLIVLGTNFIVSAALCLPMVHFCLFFLYTLLLFSTIKWHEKPSLAYMIMIASSIGLIILTRPTDIVCVLIPVFYNISSKKDIKSKWELIRHRYREFIIGSIIIATIGFIQLSYWKYTTGEFLINSYNNPGEGMDFLTPHIGKVLFSFRKGWYIYTPIMLLATVGIISSFKRHKEITFMALLFFICNIYLVACWSCWWYASSFSQRALIQSYPLMSLGLGSFIEEIRNHKNKWLHYGFPILLLSFVILNLFQSWQYQQGIIDSQRMTSKAYFANFFSTQPNPSNDRLLLIQRSTDEHEIMDSTINYQKSPVILMDFESNAYYDNICQKVAHSGTHSVVMDSINIYSPSFKRKYKEITRGEYAWINVSAWVYPTSDNEDLGSLVITFNHKGRNYKYRTVDLEKLDLKPYCWHQIHYSYLTPEPRSTKDELQVYYWHRSKKTLYLDDLKIEIFTPRK